MPVLFKELRALRPFIYLILFMCTLNIVDEAIRHQPDMRPMSETLDSYLAQGVDSSILLFLLAFALGVGLLAREHDEGTIEFLDSLPVSRSRVFLTKVSLAFGVLLLLPLTDVVIATVLQFWSRTSIAPSFHLNVLLTSFFVASCQVIVFLSLALALSFMRRFAWLAAGLLFWVYMLGIRVFAGLAVLNVFELTTPRFAGQRWLLPVDLLMVQMPLALGLTVLAYFIYVGAGDRWSRIYNRLTRSRGGAAALVAVGLAAAALLVTAVGMYGLNRNNDDENDGDREQVHVVYASWSTSHAETRYYSFSYPSNLADRAQLVMARADEVHETVRTFLGAGPDNSKIVVDMNGTSPRHSGDAYWKTIRLNLAESEDADRLVAVLGHETTHVFVDRMSDSGLTFSFNSTRFFHEGVAEYVEHRLFGSAETVRYERIIAAVLRSRREVDFKELANDNLLRQKYDPDVVYPLGEVFVFALVERYGATAPGRLIEAFARKDAQKQLSGTELWRDVFQAAGFSLEAAVDAFYAKLDSLVIQYRQFIANLPRPRGAVRSEGEDILVEILGPVDNAWETKCRFRQFATSADHDFLWGNQKGNRCWIALDYFPAATFWYQIGLVEAGGQIQVWEPWSEVRLR